GLDSRTVQCYRRMPTGRPSKSGRQPPRQPLGSVARLRDMDATVILSRPGPVYSAPAAGTPEVARQEREESDADQLVADLYHAHYTSLVRLATLLLRNHAMAEEAVQDAFVALHARWRKRGRPREAVPYLRRSVINNVRSVQRRWTVAARRPDDRP